MRRRTLLADLGGSVSLSGCLAGTRGDDEPGDASPASYPSGCPDSQDLGVALPDELSEYAVRSFLGDYEEAFVYDRYVTEEMSVGWSHDRPSRRSISANGAW